MPLLLLGVKVQPKSLCVKARHRVRLAFIALWNGQADRPWRAARR